MPSTEEPSCMEHGCSNAAVVPAASGSCPVDRLALILAPHEDDEVNIAGQILPTIVELGYRCSLCFFTNGDASEDDAPLRAREALRVADLYGISRDDVLFLGYPDADCGTHLYQCRDGTLVVRGHDRAYTYPPAPQPYSSRDGREPASLCRGSALCDLVDVFESLMPDLIICVDFDWHPDHRALSLLSEEALGIVLRSLPSYKPLFLKKFAYAGAWDAPTDYYTFKPSVVGGAETAGRDAALGNPTLFWDERISLLPHQTALTEKLENNVVYRAFALYESQRVWPHVRSVCSADVPYWVRRTDDLFVRSRVAVSSGDKRELLDFKRFDVGDILEREPTKAISHEYGWYPDDDDHCPLLMARLNTASKVALVDVYWSMDADLANTAVLVLADGECADFARSDRGHRMRLRLDRPTYCEEIVIAVPSWPTGGARIAGIEIYPCDIEHVEEVSTFVAEVNEHGRSGLLPHWGKLKDFVLKLRVFFYYRS